MLVRQARVGDMPLLKTWMTEFLTTTLPYKPMDEAHLDTLMNSCMSKHVFLVAEEDDLLLGTMCGVYLPHHLNPNISVLTELAWWVAKEHRSTGVGEALLEAFASLKKTDITVMSLLPETMGVQPALLKKGFRMMETSFVKDNGR